MASKKWDATDQYYSGQGVVLVGLRDSLGKPKGLRAMGNVSALKITNATTVLEHKESHTGQRGTDKRITTEIKVGLSITGDSFSGRNLADFLRGLLTEVAGSTVTGEAVNAYAGKVSGLAKIAVSSVAVKTGATALDEYTNDSTPWDYKVNYEHGSIKFNDGGVLARSADYGSIITAVTVGATTIITCNPGGLEVGDKVTCSGLTGADAASLNGVELTVTAVSGTGFSTDTVDTTADTITTAAGSRAVFATAYHAFTVDYTYADQELIEGLATGAQELYMRFEGLNTAESNEAVVVEVFKFLTDPLKDFDMISDTYQTFVLEGSALADSLQTGGTLYYKVTKLPSATQPA